jgi:hypothetical protein
MFLCLQQWRQKRLDGTLADIKKALEEETVNAHILCKVNMVYILMSFDFPFVRLLGVREFCYYPYLNMIVFSVLCFALSF